MRMHRAAVSSPSSSPAGGDHGWPLRWQNSIVAISATGVLPSFRGWFFTRWAHSTAALVAKSG